jgi:hypothetical protein
MLVNGTGEEAMTLWRYLWGTVVRPRHTFARLVADSASLAHGFKAVLLISALYTLTVIGLAIVKAEIMAPAWIPIPADEYYFWEIFFVMPVVLLGWILAAGVAHWLSSPFGGSGNFEGTLAVLAFAVAVPTFVTWVPETAGTILILAGAMTHGDWVEATSHPGFWQVFGLAYQLVAVAWYVFLFPIAIAQAQRLRWRQSVAVGIPTLAVFGLWMFTFIR